MAKETAKQKAERIVQEQAQRNKDDRETVNVEGQPAEVTVDEEPKTFGEIWGTSNMWKVTCDIPAKGARHFYVLATNIDGALECADLMDKGTIIGAVLEGEAYYQKEDYFNDV